jgi:hypothetical protein
MEEFFTAFERVMLRVYAGEAAEPRNRRANRY